jgi:hypothetical protein
LQATANTWKPVYRQAIGNDLRLRVSRGTLLTSYPPAVKVDALGCAELEISGGVGFVPFSFSNLKTHRNPQLVVNVEGNARPIDQSVHGNDFWQTDFGPVEGRWNVTYNVPLDSPNDAPRTVKLRFESGDAKESK